jgi:hypothetical protein
MNKKGKNTPEKKLFLSFDYLSSSVRGRSPVCGKICFWVVLSVASLCLSSCAEVGRDMGLEEIPDIQQRAGLTGTANQPAVLDPFKKYEIVMAANECRFFQMKVPERWYWKLTLTVVNREEHGQGRLVAEIIQPNLPWAPLPNTTFSKTFQLNREGVQAVLGVGNSGTDREAILRFCQEGSPLRITLQSQVSSTSQLMGPDKKKQESQGE